MNNLRKSITSRDLSIQWWNMLSSPQKTRLCDINTAILEHVRRHGTLTGREIELLYNYNYGKQ